MGLTRLEASQTGTVYIVGAGPGPGDLITVRGLRALEKADVVIADALVPRSFFDDVGIIVPDNGIIWRDAQEPALTQDQVNDLLIEHALTGRTVVRLKGGDPGVFGRGWEEAEVLSRHGIAWEIIPGLTAGTALPAQAGLPLTLRGEARSFALATGRLDGDEVNPELPRADSVLLYMSVSALPRISEQLLADGWSPRTPVTIIERGGLLWERRFRGGLGEIAQIAQEVKLTSPALIVVGEAARRRVEMPTILFTGLDPANFRTLGTLLHWPALQVVEAPDAGEQVAHALEAGQSARRVTFIFTSKAGVRAFFAAATGQARCSKDLLTGARLIAAGPGTAQMLERYGVCGATVPEVPGSEGIIGGLSERERGLCVLIQGAQATNALECELFARFEGNGGGVVRLKLHRAVPHCELGGTALPEHDAIFFTSPSGVRAYQDVFGADAFRREVLCIGEQTKAALRSLDVEGKVVHPGVAESSRSGRSSSSAT